MHVVFGASSDLGRRVVGLLIDQGCRVRAIARRPGHPPMPPLAEMHHADLSQPESIGPALAGARVVVNCAHARFTPALLSALPEQIDHVVLVGSAWRWSKAPEAAAREVRDAESLFLGSGCRGAMLHPTMIYGGAQENNLQRILRMVRRFPVLPIPGGGRHLVQPVHIDDVAAAVVAAAMRSWTAAEVLAVPGAKPLMWRTMVELCAQALNARVLLMDLPLAPFLYLTETMARLGLRPPVDPNILRRFREDVTFPVAPLHAALGISPRPFQSGLRDALSAWQTEGGRR